MINSRKRELQKRLQAKKQDCDALLARIERNQLSLVPTQGELSFSRESFTNLAETKLGQNWNVLDYHMTEDQLIVARFSPTDLEAYKIPLSHRFRKALSICQQSHNNGSLPSEKDLEVLNETLIPPNLQVQLTPDTILFLVPHQELHGLPWAGLGKDPLVMKCVPVVIPSLQTLTLLWRREKKERRLSPKRVLLLGVSHFDGRYPDLPYVDKELMLLQEICGAQSECLAVDKIRINQLKEFLHTNNAKIRFDYMHIATHFFSDSVTGRLSGFALEDEDVWLDQFRDFAPLPGMITFSGCNSIYGRIYAGDEQISLISACFSAGVNSIIGSVWQILDQSAPALMLGFYKHLAEGGSPAQSLCFTQREAANSGLDLRQWAGFSCIGIP